MYIVNTTFVIEPDIHDRWYRLMTEKVIPAITAQQFDIVAFTCVLSEQSDGHHTYSLQVAAQDIASYEQFMTQIIGDYVAISKELFGEKALHFTTLLKKIVL